MLVTSNPNLIEFKTKELYISILGGMNLTALDRLRVTLKLSKPKNSGQAIRHNIDLYNNAAVEKFTRTVAERLEIGTSIIRKHIQELTNQLESYRLEQLEEKQEVVELSPKDKAEALKFLKSKNLLEKTQDLIAQSGIVGEINNRLLMFLIFTSRKSENPLHCISLAKSGLGKSHLQNGIGALMPTEDVIEITSLSSNALYYFGKDELNQKLLLIEDMDGAESALYPIRELQSKRKLTKTVVHKDVKGERKTIHITVNGNVTVAGCTTQESVYEDNANRSFLLYIDESKEQDELIMQYQRMKYAGKISIEKEKEARRLLQNAQRMLKSVKVVNPYAEHIYLPSSVFKPRRTYAHYLAFIETVAFYHQFQKKVHESKDGNVYIEVSTEDIRVANDLILETLIRKSDVLNGATRNYYEQLKQYLQSENKQTFEASEVRREFKLKKTTQWRYHKQLLDYGLLEPLKQNNTKQVQYKLKEEPNFSFEELKNSIKERLDQNIVEISSK